MARLVQVVPQLAHHHARELITNNQSNNYPESSQPFAVAYLQLMAQHKVTAEGFGSYEVESGTKLVKALENNGVDVSHRCGGQARCTTCRVKFLSDEPIMGQLEKDCLEEDGVLGQFRLSCQIHVDQDMSVEVLMPVSTASWDNPGGEVED